MARIVSSDFTKSVTKGVQTAMMKGFQHAPAEYTKVAMVINSTLPTETLAWLGQAHKPREWTDQRIAHDLSEYSLTITNKLYEDTMPVNRVALEDEQYGQITPRAMSMGEAGALFIDELVWTELAGGYSTACYDGQNFFSNSHSEKNSGTQDNLTTVALTQAAVSDARAEMRQFKDDQGRYLNVVPDTLIVHPDDEAEAGKIVFGDKDPDNANGQWNPSYGKYGLIVRPELTAGNWILARLNGYLKPLLWSNRTSIEFQEDKTKWFSEDLIQYGIRFRGAAALGDWRLCYGSSYGS